MLNKGDVVSISQAVFGIKTHKSENGNSTGPIIRVIQKRTLKEPIKGIVLGYSFVRTGDVVLSSGGRANQQGFNDDYEPGYLESITDNKVWIIEPLTNKNRYIEPIRALECDIKPENQPPKKK